MNSINQTSPLEKFPRDQTLRMRQTYIGGSCALFYKDSPLKIVRGEGQYMYDEAGNQYLDCINNVAHVGHCHPHVTKCAMEQMSLIYTNCRYLHDNIVLYAKRLTETLPNKLQVCYFVNSGSEANDLALRLARAHTGNEDVICLDGAYHGHLTSMTDISPYKFNKLKNGKKDYVHVAPLPCNFKGKYTKYTYKNEDLGMLYSGEVKNLINHAHNNGRSIGAFIAESMVSCGGQVILPPGYLKNVYKYVHEAGGITIADEVQTGFGRIGSHMWAFELQGKDVVPDIVTIGKPMGNGHPVAAVVTTIEIAKSFQNLGIEYFNTYGGNPVSMAVANAVLDVIENEKLLEHATKVGHYLMNAFQEMQDRHFLIGDVRGIGLFIGIELVKNRTTKEPAAEETTYIVQRLRERRIIMSTEGIHGNVLKFKPPMVFSMENALSLVNAIDSIMDDLETKTCIKALSMERAETLSAERADNSSDESMVSDASFSDEEIISPIVYAPLSLRVAS